MGRHFGWVVDFFLGGVGEGKRNSRARLPRRFRRRREFQTALLYMLYIIYSAVSPILDALGRHVRCSGFDNPSTESHIEDGEGAAAPRSATDSTEQWV